MADQLTPLHGPMRIDVIFVRRCLGAWSTEQLQRLHRLAVKKRCYQLAGLLRGECERRAIPLPALRRRADQKSVHPVRRDVGIGGAR